MLEILKIGLGVLAGLLWATIGYAVARTKAQPFDPKNFGTTLILGLILGSLALALDMDITTLEGYTVLQLITIVVDKLVGLLEKPPTK